VFRRFVKKPFFLFVDIMHKICFYSQKLLSQISKSNLYKNGDKNKIELASPSDILKVL